MKLTRIAWAPYRIPFVTPYETARGAVTHREGFIVRALSDDGIVGLGEASLDPSSPQSPSFMSLHIENLARAVVGREEEAVDGAMQPYLDGDDMQRAVHCALETALLDVAGKIVGVPMAQLLSGDPDGPPAVAPGALAVLVNATIAARETSRAVEAAGAAEEQGFTCIKLKVGMETTIAAEIERIKAVRAVLDPEIYLRIDANGAWDEARAIETLNLLDPDEIEFVEQPVPAADLEALGRVSAAVKVPVAADEPVTGIDTGLRSMMYADGIILKPMRLGGPTVHRALAGGTENFGLFNVTTTTIDTGIATALALQCACMMPDEEYAHGLATASLLEHDLLVESLSCAHGIMALPLLPGLGVELDEEAVKKYCGEWREVR